MSTEEKTRWIRQRTSGASSESNFASPLIPIFQLDDLNSSM